MDKDVKEWLAIRNEAGLKIDPMTAEVYWKYAEVLDPYGVLDLRAEERCIGRSYFARAPGSDIWVSFYDLPEQVCRELRRLYDAECRRRAAMQRGLEVSPSEREWPDEDDDFPF
jgi:coproporphyrinogen III oxidase